MKRIYAVAAALLVVFTACGGKHKMPLEGTMWKLDKMAGIPAEAIAAEADNFTLTFIAAEMRVAGRTNCNRFFGAYELKGREVDFDNMGMTRMACPDMLYEDMFVKMLDEADKYKIKGDRLTFYDDRRVLSEFRAVAAQPAK